MRAEGCLARIQRGDDVDASTRGTNVARRAEVLAYAHACEPISVRGTQSFLGVGATQAHKTLRRLVRLGDLLPVTGYALGLSKGRRGDHVWFLLTPEGRERLVERATLLIAAS